MSNLKWWVPAVAAACIFVPALQVNADTAAEAKKAIQAQYDKWIKPRLTGMSMA